MATTSMQTVLRHLRRSLGAPTADGLSDRQLLEQFAAARDEAAFAALVRRHGPLVWGVCRRVLRDPHDAEDAFQATFLALARQAATTAWRESVGGWLHDVAYRVASKLKVADARRQARERRAAGRGEPAAPSAAGLQELGLLLDEEVRRLPEPCRLPVLLCYFEGRTRDQAAQQLGWSLRTLERRLARGRELLRVRLGRRGVSLSAALLAVGLAGDGAAAVPPLLTAAIARAVVEGRASPEAVGLADAVVPGSAPLKWKAVAALVLTLGMVVGTGVVRQAPADPPPTQRKQPSPELPDAPEAPKVRTDRHGDPLPKGALARLGTVRFRHGYSFEELCFSPDGKVLATAGLGRALCLWDLRTGKLLHHFETEKRSIPSAYFAAFFPDGKRIAYNGGSILSVRDLEAGKELYRIDRTSGIVPLAVSPDGSTLAYAAHPDIKLCDAASGKETRTLKGYEKFVNVLAFSPGGGVLASSGDDGKIVLWDAAGGTELRRWAGHTDYVEALAFSPDGKLLASAGQDRTARLWDVATGKEKRTVFRGEKAGVRCVAFSPDGKHLAYNDWGNVCLHEVDTGKEVRRWRASGIMVVALAFSPDGKLLASGGVFDSAARLWDPATGEEVRPSAGHTSIVDILRFSADGKSLLSFARDQKLIRWDLSAGKPDHARLMEGMPGTLMNTALSQDGKLLVRGRWQDKSVRLWDAATGKELRLLGEHEGRVQGVAISADGKLVASAGEEGAVVVREAATGKELHRFESLKGGGENHMRLVFAPNGNTLAAGCDDRKVRLWEVGTGKKRAIETPIKPNSLVFSPDGKRMAVAEWYRERPVLIYEVATGKLLQTCEGHVSGHYGLAFSPDGRLLAASGTETDSKVRVWEAATGRLIHLFDGYPKGVGVLALAFAPDGRTLASGGGDSTILLWDLTGGAKPAKLSEKRLKELWKALADPDPAKAYPALWRLAVSHKDAVPFLKRQLPPARAVDAKAFAKLITGLESDSFRERQGAEEKIEQLGFGAEPALRQVLAGNPPLETRRRVEELLNRVTRSDEWLRASRVLAALEHAGTPEARTALRELAQGVPGARLTAEAQAALRRLDGKEISEE